jgi:hypothetical protein
MPVLEIITGPYGSGGSTADRPHALVAVSGVRASA